MPNPQRHVFHRGQLQETLNLVEIRAAVLEIIRFGEEFQVAQNQIRVRQHLFRFGEIAHAGGIERGVYAVLMQPGEELLDKLSLQERLAAGDGHAAAVLPVRTKPESLSDQLIHVGRCAAFGQPGIGIMAIDAPQRAALHKYDVSHAGAVHRAEGLNGMNVSGHIATFLSSQKSFCSIRSPYPGEGLSLESSEGIRGTRRGRRAAVSPRKPKG